MATQHTTQRPGQGKTTRAVMTRPTTDVHRALELIAQHENRKSGPQATVFIREGVQRYLESNPELAKQIQA